MKKVFILTSIFLSLFLVGCQKQNDLRDSFSEITYQYFYGEIDGLKASISSGEREINYKIDGKHTKNCDFSLIYLNFDKHIAENAISVKVFINEKAYEINAEYNPLNDMYMSDLGFELKNDDQIKIFYQNFELNLANISDNFAIKYDKAIDLALNELTDEEKQNFYNKNVFEGECYLKIISQKDGESDELFWLFTIVNKNKVTKNVIINVKNGSILLKN